MTRCPITYEALPEGVKYSHAGLRRLSPRLTELRDLPWTAAVQRKEAVLRASKMSIQGMQPKLSARINVPEGRFDIVDRVGKFILKPQTDYPEVPENEDLTMRLAGTAGIEAPVHGMVYCPDGTRTYFIKRFDRSAKGGKVPVEDFAQLSGRTRDTKYDSSMEKVADVVGRFCTFPVVEKLKLFRLTLFNYLTGNEDAHLKNFSLITRDGIVGLSPVYDLLNTTIVLDRPIEEVALPIDGRKKNLSRSLFVNYFGKERLGLTGGTVDEVLSGLARGMREWEELIGISFLTDRMKERYLEVLGVRRKILEI